MASNIEGIQDLLAGSPETPIVSAVDGKVFQISLSQALMKEAERIRPWLTTGIDEWVKAGRWWLMKVYSLRGESHPLTEEAHLLISLKADYIQQWLLEPCLCKPMQTSSRLPGY
jgi:hypothetical protein